MGDSQEQSDASQPNWDALPHDPQAFFGLAEEFDRRDLKRSYSKLIRVYKPERHPAEFQRIRAAYEQLDRELRYGRSAETATLPAQRWDEIAAATEQEDRDEQPANREKPTKRRSVPEQLVDRVLSESPQKVYDEIAERADKSPYDYYCLAVLSDLLKPRKTTRFSRWLVKGVEAHPFEPNLLYLLREDLTRTAREADLPDLLEACAQAVPRDDFFALTEPAWERLLRTIPFGQFVALLERCEAHLRDISISYRVTFMMRVLRHAVWSDQREWVDEAFAFVEQNFQEIPPALENEIELLAAVAHYTALREQFLDHSLDGNSLREQMDNALQQYMTQEAAVGDQAVLEVQLAILAEPQATLAAFAPEDNEAVAAFYDAWTWAAADVAERYGQSFTDVETQLFLNRMTPLIRQCHGRMHRDRRNLSYHSRLVLVMTSFHIICAAAIILISGFVGIGLLANGGLLGQDYSLYVFILIFVFIVAGAVFMVKQHRRMLEKRAKSARKEELDLYLYRTYYREELVQFCRETTLPYHYLRGLAQHANAVCSEHQLTVLSRINLDYGLAIYSLALPLAT